MVRVHPCLPFDSAACGLAGFSFFFMSQISVTLPDGSSRSVPSGTPVRDVAEGISPRLAQAALAGVVNGSLVDLSFPLKGDAAVRIVTSYRDRFPEPSDNSALRHSPRPGPPDDDLGTQSFLR